MKQAVVLCGGLGTRMRGVAGDGPKILLDVLDRPFLDHLLDRLEACKIDQVLLCIGHRGELVRDAVAKGRRRSLDVRFSDEGDRRLGTAGALRGALESLADTFVVTYGDSYLTFDYASPLGLLQADPSADGCMAVYRNDDALEPSNAAIEGGRVARYDKQRAATGPVLDHIDYGATALRKSVIEAIAPGQALGLDVIQARLANEGSLLACVAEERFYEIGSPSGLSDLVRFLGGELPPDRGDQRV